MSPVQPPPTFRRSRPLRARDVQLYHVCEDLTEVLIYAMVIFGPWAFGTTQAWSIRVMNVAGYLSGVLLACKLAIRQLKGYRPASWAGAQGEARQSSHLSPPRLTAALVALTIAILAYCLVSAINARATFHPDQGSFEYADPGRWLNWLPHSLDSSRTWPADSP